MNRDHLFKNAVLTLLFMVFIAPSVSAQLPDFTGMIKENGHAVVNISSTQKIPKIAASLRGGDMPQNIPPEMEELFKHFLNPPNGGFRPKDAKSLGSGFIISTDGFVLTNHHVVNNADEIIVKLKDRRELVAKLIGSDERTDIALLKIEATNLPAVKIGRSDILQVGEWVLAIGTPFGFEQSVTAGIVSAKGRSLPNGNYVPFIQTDVAINPGNSGGPLFNMKGEVVGVNSQIYSRSGGYMGLSFSIPMDVAMNVVKQLKTTGAVSRGWLGVQIQDVTRELAESFNMDRPHGALVAKVTRGSPAEKSHLQIGDIIVGFDGHTINTSGELPPVVGITTVGEAVKVNVIRNGKNKVITVVVGLLPEADGAVSRTNQTKKSPNKLGLTVIPLDKKQRKQLELPQQGVLVQSVSQGAGESAGIRRGDVILRVKNNIVRDVSGFDKIVKSLSAGQSIAILIQRRGNPVFLALKIDK